MLVLGYIVIIVAAYLLGSIPCGLVLTRVFAATDVRLSGSGAVDLRIQQLLFRHHRMDNVLDLSFGIASFPPVGVFCHQLDIKLECSRNVATRIVCGIGRRIKVRNALWLCALSDCMQNPRHERAECAPRPSVG